MNNEEEQQSKGPSLLGNVFARLPLKYKLIILGGCLILFLIVLIILAAITDEAADVGFQDTPESAYANKMCTLDVPLKSYSISGLYGYRTSQSKYGSKFHEGVDLATSYGEPVTSAMVGKVIAVHKTNDGGYGRYIEIESEDGTYRTKYAHLSKVNVNVGDYVTTDTIIGNVGGSGLGSDNTYGAHLHFEYKERSGLAGTSNVFKTVSANNMFGYTDVDKCINKKIYLSSAKLNQVRNDCNINSSRKMSETDIQIYNTSCYGSLELEEVLDCPTNEIGIRIVDCPDLQLTSDDANFPGGYSDKNGLRVANDFISMDDYVKAVTYNYFTSDIMMENIESLKFFMVAVKSRLWNQALSGGSNIQLTSNEILVPVTNCYEQFYWDKYANEMFESQKLVLNSAYDAVEDVLIYDKGGKVNNSLYGDALAIKAVSMSQNGFPYQLMIKNSLIQDSISYDKSIQDTIESYKDTDFVKCRRDNAQIH